MIKSFILFLWSLLTLSGSLVVVLGSKESLSGDSKELTLTPEEDNQLEHFRMELVQDMIKKDTGILALEKAENEKSVAYGEAVNSVNQEKLQEINQKVRAMTEANEDLSNLSRLEDEEELVRQGLHEAEMKNSTSIETSEYSDNVIIEALRNELSAKTTERQTLQSKVNAKALDEYQKLVQERLALFVPVKSASDAYDQAQITLAEAIKDAIKSVNKDSDLLAKVEAKKAEILQERENALKESATAKRLEEEGRRKSEKPKISYLRKNR